MGSVKWLGAVVVLFAGCAPRSPGVLATQLKPPDDVAVIRAAADHFLRVFDDLDWELFRTCWASEPSVFGPSDDTPERVNGRTEVEAGFRRFFDEVRAETPGPPYLHLHPRELRQG